MKLAYTSPKITVHGKVENLTQVTGNNTSTDQLLFNGKPTGVESNDSQDFDIANP